MDDYSFNDSLRWADEWLSNRPVCDHCGNPIQESYMYEIDNEQLCPDCIDWYLRQYRVAIGG